MKSSENTFQRAHKTVSDLALQEVGIIKNSIKKPFLAIGKNGIKMQRQTDEAIAEYHNTRLEMSKIIVRGKWADILEGIEEYSHLVVLYWAHRIPEQNRSLHRVHPMGKKEFPKVGIFCTFSPARPNPLLMTVVRLHRRNENVLEVTGLDAVDGSPVLDIKPYVKEFYPREEVIIPEWMQSILQKIDEVMG